jgi:hypothetical protein
MRQQALLKKRADAAAALGGDAGGGKDSIVGHPSGGEAVSRSFEKRKPKDSNTGCTTTENRRKH